ncbi:GyrI-like domain-containing protein [Bdellovibrionales bacterium]|nr:GyrI-like domain-containing protein [Bdellovibrionales bacterium]
MIHWIWISLISGISVLLISLYINLGGYKEVSIEVRPFDGFHIIYRQHVGPYHKINPTIESVEKWLKQNKIECLKAFGEYLDKPGTIEDSRLRSHGGCLVENRPTIPLPEGVTHRFVKPQTIVYATFSGAPSIAPIFVYPKIEETLASKKLTALGPIFEIYNPALNKAPLTEYLCPLKL